MPKMRAKMVIGAVLASGGGEQLTMNAVCKSGSYGDDGLDENNTFAHFTPSAELVMQVNNPALNGVFKEGQELYLDFTVVGEVESAEPLVNFAFGIDQPVKTPFGDGIISMLCVDDGGKCYYVRTAANSQWFKEAELIARH